MSAADLIAARHSRVVEVVDARGRTIGVRRLRPSERLFLAELAEARREAVEPLICAAAVVFVEDDDGRRTLPTVLREPVLWALVARLGEDGLAAVTYALWQHAAGPAGGPPTSHPFRLLPVVEAPAPPKLPAAPRGLSIPARFASGAIDPSFYKL